MIDWGPSLAAGTGLLTTLGGGTAFIWNKVERRFREIEVKLEECQAREHESLARRSVQLTVIELLWQEVQRHAPGSVVLSRAKHLLDELKSRADLDALTGATARLELLIERERKQ